MKKIYKILNKCRSCGSKKIFNAFSNNASPLGESFLEKKNTLAITNKRYPIDLMICRVCSLAQLSIIVDPNLLYKDYLYITESSPTLLKHFKEASKKLISKLKIKKKSRVLDIGSNDGTLLEFFKKKDFHVTGIEPAKPASKISKSKGINTIQAFFNLQTINKHSLNKKNFHLIVANNVFANIDNINSWMRNIKKILSPDGVFVFESSYLYDVVFNNVFDFIYHEHLSYFSITSVKKLCEKHDLKLFDLDHISTKGGSIRYYISKNKNKKINNSIQNYLNKEKKFKLFNKSTYLKLKTKINNQKNKLKHFIKFNQKKNIIGFGASISCITLMYEFNIENKIKYLIDDNKIKQGKFSPGSNIKIFSPKKYQISKKDIVLILPWRFQEMILKNHKSKLKKANQIIQVWPKFTKIHL